MDRETFNIERRKLKLLCQGVAEMQRRANYRGKGVTTPTPDGIDMWHWHAIVWDAIDKAYGVNMTGDILARTTLRTRVKYGPRLGGKLNLPR